jgi:hypothetical protein
MFDPQPEHVWVSDTPMVRFSWGAIKGPHASLARLATHFILKHFDTLSSAPNLSPPSFSPALSSSSYPLIFLFEGVAPKMSLRKCFSWLFKLKFLFEKFSSFCGLYPILDLHSMVFKPLNLHVYPSKRIKLSHVDFGCSGKTGLFGFRNWTIRFSLV